MVGTPILQPEAVTKARNPLDKLTIIYRDVVGLKAVIAWSRCLSDMT